MTAETAPPAEVRAILVRKDFKGLDLSDLWNVLAETHGQTVKVSEYADAFDGEMAMAPWIAVYDKFSFLIEFHEVPFTSCLAHTPGFPDLASPAISEQTIRAMLQGRGIIELQLTKAPTSLNREARIQQLYHMFGMLLKLDCLGVFLPYAQVFRGANEYREIKDPKKERKKLISFFTKIDLVDLEGGVKWIHTHGAEYFEKPDLEYHFGKSEGPRKSQAMLLEALLKTISVAKQPKPGQALKLDSKFGPLVWAKSEATEDHAYGALGVTALQRPGKKGAGRTKKK